MDGLQLSLESIRSDLPPLGSSADHVRPGLAATDGVIERIGVATMAIPGRVLGVAGCGGAAHHALSRLLAERRARSGETTLLLDLSGPLAADSDRSHWVPGDGRAGNAVLADPRGFDRLTPTICPRTVMRFRSIAGLRQLLQQELSMYGAIVVDVGGLDGSDHAAVPAATVAQACDGIVLTAEPGTVVRRQLASEVEALGAARDRVVGYVIDDYQAPTIGEDILALAERTKRLPKLARRGLEWLGRRRLLWERV
jgi:hypothetical protein